LTCAHEDHIDSGRSRTLIVLPQALCSRTIHDAQHRAPPRYRARPFAVDHLLYARVLIDG